MISGNFHMKLLPYAHRFALLVALLFAVLSASPASAAIDDIFTVRNVPVDATANEAAEARIIAIRQGRQTALRLLFQRLTMQVDWPLLPYLPTSEVTSIGAGFEVSGERNSPTRYLATITYRFKPNEIRRILQEYDIPFSEAQARAMVVLPVFVRGDEILIWEEDNPWTKAWTTRNYSHELVAIHTPLGDLGDVMATSAEAVSSADYVELAVYADRYGVQDVLLAIVTQKAENAPLALEVFRVGPTETESFKLLLPLAGAIKASMEFAIDRVVEKLQEDWKTKTIIRYGDQRPMTVSAQYNSLGDWLKIRSAMEATPNVVESELVALSTNGAHMSWSVVGTPDQLGLALAQYSVTLRPGASSGASPDRAGLSQSSTDRSRYSGTSLPTGDSGRFGTYSGYSRVEPDYWVIRYEPQRVVDEKPFTLEDEGDQSSLDGSMGAPQLD